MDRFAAPTAPDEPKEVGSCEACGGVVYDYERDTCPSCDSPIHTGCKKHCKACGSHGCRTCLSQNPDTLEWTCENCMLKQMESEEL